MIAALCYHIAEPYGDLAPPREGTGTSVAPTRNPLLPPSHRSLAAAAGTSRGRLMQEPGWQGPRAAAYSPPCCSRQDPPSLHHPSPVSV